MQQLLRVISTEDFPRKEQLATKASKFLTRFKEWYQLNGFSFKEPEIFIGEGNSIDMLWQTDKARLLVRVLNFKQITYYADDFKEPLLEGYINIGYLAHKNLKDIFSKFYFLIK